MSNTAQWIVGVLITLLGLSLSVLTFVIGRMKEARHAGKLDGETAAEIRHLGTDVKAMNSELCSRIGGLSVRMDEHERADRASVAQITRAQESASAAHHRLDNHDARIQSLEVEKRKEM